MLDLYDINLKKAAQILKSAKHVTAFTGAGISVESGIPSYRGQGGIWLKYNPRILELNYFFNNPEDSWSHIRTVFYDYFADAQPNTAHHILAKWEETGVIKSVITQNIDNLHQKAGSKNVIEFHGNSQILSCTKCPEKYKSEEIGLDTIPPVCPRCGGLLKPDFIFFGENIPAEAFAKSNKESETADVFIVIGTTGEVYPAAAIPHAASQKGAAIIEINPENSAFSNSVTDVHIKGKAGTVLSELNELIAI